MLFKTFKFSCDIREFSPEFCSKCEKCPFFRAMAHHSTDLNGAQINVNTNKCKKYNVN